MTILLVLVPISLLLLGLAIWAFVWAVRSGQYDDLDSPAIDVLRSDTVDAAPIVVRSDAAVAAPVVRGDPAECDDAD